MANQIKYQVGFDIQRQNLNQLKTSLQQLQKIKISQVMKINQSDTSSARKALLNIRTEAENVENALKQAFNTKLNTVNIQAFNKSLKNSGTSIQQVYNSFKSAGAVGQNAFRNLSSAVLSSNIQLKQSHNILNKMAVTLTNSIKWHAATAAINGVTMAVHQAWSYVKSLDTSLNNIRIVTGKSAEEMSKFAVQANNAAKELGRTTTDYTNAALIYAQQGLSDKEIEERAKITLKAANVTGQSTDAVSEQLTAVWNGYKVTAEEAELYVDRLAAVAATSASNLQELSTGMSKVASAAAAMGVGEDQLAAQLSTIISVTRQAPESVGTALRTIYARISDIKAGIDEDGVTLGNYSGKMAELGFNVLDANGNLRDMGEVIEEIGGKWGTLTREQQVYLTQTMAGQRQYNNLLALFDNFEQYNKELLVAQEAEGTLTKQQEIRMDSIDAHLKILKASMEDIYNSLADPKSLNAFIDGLSSVATFFARFVDSIGGGAGALRLLGTIGFNVFSERIGKSINTTINNLQAGRQNAAQFDMQLKSLSQFKGISGLDKMSIDILNSREQLLQLSKSMTPEQFSGMQSLLHNIEASANQVTILNQQYQSLQKIVNLVSKEKISNLSPEARQRVQEAVQGFTNLSENIQKVKNKITSLNFKRLTPKIKEAFSDARSSIDDFIQKLNTLNENGFLSGHQTELKNVMQQYKQLPASINTEEAKQKFITFFDSLGTLAQKAEGPLRGVFEQLVAEFNNGDLEGALKRGKEQFEQFVNQYERSLQRIKKEQSIQNWTKMASGIASVGSAIQQVKNIGSIWSKSDLSFGQKMLQTVTNLAISLPMLFSGLGKINVALKLLKISTLEEVNTTLAASGAQLNHFRILKATQTQAGKTAIALRLMGNKTLLVSPWMLLIAGVTAAISILGAFDSAAKKSAEQQRQLLQKQIEREKKVQEEVDNNKKLYSSLSDLNEQFENHEITRGELKSAVEDLIQQYGLEAEAADTLRDSYRNLDDYLQKHRTEEIKRGAESAKRRVDAAGVAALNKLEEQQQYLSFFDPSMMMYDIEKGFNSYVLSELNENIPTSQNSVLSQFGFQDKRYDILEPLIVRGQKSQSLFLGTESNELDSLVQFYDNVGVAIQKFGSILSIEELKQDEYYQTLSKWYEAVTPQMEEYKQSRKQSLQLQNEAMALEAENSGIINFNNSDIQSAIDFANEREKLIEQQKALLTEQEDTESDPAALADAYLTEYHGTLSQKYLETSKVISNFREQISDDNKEIQKEVEDMISKLDEKHLDAFVDLELSTVDNWQRLLEILNQISKLNFDYDSSRLKLGPESLQEDASKQYQIYASLEQQIRSGKTISSKELQELDPQLQSYFSMMANGSYKMTKDAQTFYNKVNNLKLEGFFDTISSIEQENQRLQKLSSQSDIINQKDKDIWTEVRIGGQDPQGRGSRNISVKALDQNAIQEQLAFLEAITDKNSQFAVQIGAWKDTFSRNLNFNNKDLIAQAEEIQDAFENAQDAARKDLENSPARLRELAKMTEQINHQIHDAMFPTDADIDEGILASLTGTIQQIADESDDLADSLTEDARAAEDVSEAVLRFDDAINDVVENYDEWLAALNSGNIQQQAEIIDKLRDAYGDLLDIDGSVLSTDFLTNTENLNLMKAAIDGDIDAYNQLVNLSGQDIAVQLGVDLSTFYADRDAIQASIQEFTGQDFDDIEIGAKLNNQNFLNGLTDLVNAANMTAQQATAYLADMGVNAEVVQHSTEAEQQSEDIAWSSKLTPRQVPADDLVLSMQGPFPAPRPIQQRITEWNQEVTAQPVPGKAIKRNKAFSLKVTSANKSSGGEFKFSQAKNGAGSKGAARRSPTTSSKGSGGGRSGGSGTKAASPDTSKKDTKKAMEDTRDIYHDINIEIEQINRRLDRVQKQQDRLYGKQLLDNLNRQSKILEKQKDLLKEKQELQKQDLAAQQETLKNLGVTFDKYGNITDYMSLLGSRQAEINALTSQYNGLIEAYNQSTDKDVKKGIADQAEALNKRIKAAEDEYKDLEKKIKDYDGLRKDMEDLVDEMEEITQKQIELNIEKFNMEVKIRLDMGEAERDWNQFRRDVLEHTDLMKDSDFSKNFKDVLQNSRNLSSYFYVGGSKGSLQTLTEQLLATRKEIEDINKIGTSAIYGDNKAKAMQDLQNNLNELMKQMGEIESLIDQIDEKYFDTIEKINEEFDKQIEDYEYIGELIEHDMDLLTLLYGQKNYEAMDNYYSTLEKNNLKQLDSLKRQREFWKQQWEAAVARGDTQAAKQFEQNYKNTIKNLNQLIEDSAKTLQDKYSNAINKIFNDLDKKLTNGHGLDYLGMEWDLMNKNADEYLDTINSAFAVQETQRKYQKAIDDTKSIKNQQVLKKLMDQQLGILKDKEKITQYDVDRAEKLLQVEQARIALEEAQSAKTSMRLKRDSQGNYSYEYVADDDAIGEAQDNLAKAQNDLYNFDKERYYNNLKDIYDMTKEFEQKYKEIILDASLTEQEKIEQLALLREQYAEYINDKTAQNLVVRQNLMDSAFNDMAALYQTDVANYNQMSTDEKNILMGDLVPAWDSGIQQMADKVVGEGGFIPACQEAFENVDNATQEYEKDLDQLATAAGIDLNDVKNGVDDLALEFDDLIEKNDSLIDRMGLEMGAIQSLRNQAQQLVQDYNGVFDAAKNAVSQLHQFVQAEQAAAAAYAQTATAYEEMVNRIQTANASYAANPYGSTAINYQSSSGDGGSSSGSGNGGSSTGGGNESGSVQTTTTTEKTTVIKKSRLGGGGSLPGATNLIAAYGEGGYTGTWDNNNGKLAILHQKELVLNQDDTKNILNSVKILRTLSESLQTNLFGRFNKPANQSMFNSSEQIEQNVHIEANFPNVDSKREIEEAFNDLVNLAAQRAMRK